MRAVLLSALILGLVAGSAAASPTSSAGCIPTEELRNRLARHEGIRRCVYEDQFGNPTIGVGHLLKKPVPPDLCWSLTKTGAALEHDIARARANARHDLGDDAWARLPHRQRDVLTEMAFQIGGSGLAHFKHMLASVRAGDYDQAADHLLDSLLARQTPARANELACLMRGAD